MSRAMQRSDPHRYAGTTVQVVSLAVGIVFLLVGVLGFIPGVTTGYGELHVIGHESGALLLGVFQVSVFHNIVHLLFGLAGVTFAATAVGSRNFLVWGGAIYAVFGIYGLIVGQDSVANIVPFNMADNWLHFGLAIGMIALGVLLPRSTGSRSSRMPTAEESM